MNLIDVEKAVYRKNLNIVIGVFVSCFLVLSLILGAGFIAAFSDGQSSNFRFNLFGVILSLLCCLTVLHKFKSSVFFKEIYYVWQLKQIHNYIYRRLKKIKSASLTGDVHALIILNFYYQSTKQVYLLDDNTLVISKLEKDISALDEILQKNNIQVSTEQFDKTLLAAFK
ncbi:MAG: DUF3087 domain-containing protein [Alteromonadaceae bacterium]|nr:DUF3087 domain-containing protein [Alteromonadaceae bacterium]